RRKALRPDDVARGLQQSGPGVAAFRMIFGRSWHEKHYQPVGMFVKAVCPMPPGPVCSKALAEAAGNPLSLRQYGSTNAKRPRLMIRHFTPYILVTLIV